MNRQELEAKIMWNNGGYGFGVTRVGSMMAWAMAEPKSKEDDLPSVVAVCGPPEKYTDEELEKLAAFSEERTARYDEMFTVRMGANLTIFDKVMYEGATTPWMRKRMSWESGPMYSATIDEAIEFMRR